MKNWKGTTGKVFSVVSDIDYSGTYTVRCDNRGVTFGEDEHNAALFADAINTVNKCDLMPSELLKQRDELLAQLKSVLAHKNLIEYPMDSKPEHHGEAIAISQMFSNIDYLIKQIEQ